MLSHQSLLHWLHFLQFFQAIFCGSNQILLVLAMTTNSELLQHFVFLYFFSLYFQMFLLHPACDYLFAYILHLCIFVFCILFHLHPASDYLFTIDADKINSGAPHLTFHNGFSKIKETDNSPNNVLSLLLLSYAFSSSLAFSRVLSVFLAFFHAGCAQCPPTWSGGPCGSRFKMGTILV